MSFLKGVSISTMAVMAAIAFGAEANDRDPSSKVDGDVILENTSILASDKFQGRLPGTEGGRLTEGFLAKTWESYGVQPANNGSYFQEVRLVGTTEVSTEEAVIRGHGGELRYQDKTQITFSGSKAALSAALDDSELVFVGYGITAPEYGWDDYANVDVRGKTVVALWGDPGVHSAEERPEFFKGKAATLYGLSTFKAEEAARNGAAGIFLIHDPALAGWPWQVAQNGAASTKYQIADPETPKPQPEMGGLISAEAAADIFALAGQDIEALKVAARDSSFEAVPLGLRMSASARNELSEVVSNNVVGIIPGTKRPDEYILYTAHWDHVGVKEGMEGDNIFNGAMDNATGTAGITEVARVMAGMEEGPERSIVFIATTAEEQGLLGAFYYVDNPLYPLKDTVGVFNMDAHYPYGAFDGQLIVGMGSSDLEQYIIDAAEEIGRTSYPNPAPEQGGFFRSDHYPFAKAGVPSIYTIGAPYPREDAEMTAQAQLMVDYGMNKYHKAGDEVDPETWDMAGIVGDVQVYLKAGLALARDARVPNWSYNNEFRAIRDRMISSDR